MIDTKTLDFPSITYTRHKGITRVYVKYLCDTPPNISDYIDVTLMELKNSVTYTDSNGNKFTSLQYEINKVEYKND